MLWIFTLFGCPLVSDGEYDAKVRDADGDGGIAERFGGPDCVDGDATVADCDADGDGVRTQAAGGDDCDDNDPSVHPGATEVCSGRDEDCDGLIDDQDPDVAGQIRVWLDADGDDVGGSVALETCDPPNGYVPVSGDCDDADATINPSAVESCDEIDHNCDGEIRAGATNTITWYVDADGDGLGGVVSGVSCAPPNPDDTSTGGDCDDADPTATLPRVFYADADGDDHGVPSVSVQACLMPPHHAALGDDCDDNNPDRYPQAFELCDGIDNDCDQLIDDADNDVFSPPTWFADADGDGFTVPFDFVRTCVPPNHYAQGSLLEDCNDSDAAVNPDQQEQCDDPAVDNDCDGLINEEDPDYEGILYYVDSDLDGYGVGAPITACLQPVGYSARDGDCDDTNRLVNPETTWYADGDGDGFGAGDAWTVACNPPGAWSLDSTDCDDSNASVNPGASEVCGIPGLDENCTGSADGGDMSLINGQRFGPDRDGDGVPVDANAVLACGVMDAPAHHALLLPGAPSDCDDHDPNRYPGRPEIYYDGDDENCDVSDEYDADGDGFDCTTVENPACPFEAGDPNGDCDDTDADVNPSATEIWYDTIDQDCDGNRYDADGDGFSARLPDGYPPYHRDDADRDGLFDVLEHGAHCAPGFDPHGYPCTDPTDADTDDDGVPDGLEILLHTDPRDPNDVPLFQPGDDPDGDGLTTMHEADLLTDPFDPDTDGDGVPDGQELDFGTDPLSSDLDCNDVDPLRYPQIYGFDGNQFVRTGLNPPAGCDTSMVTDLQELVDCNCANTLVAPPGLMRAAVDLTGGTLHVLGTGEPLDEPSLSAGTFGNCEGSTSFSCITRADEDGLNAPLFTVSDGPDPTFPGERRDGVLILQQVVLLSGRSLRGGAVWAKEGGLAVVEQSVFTRNLAYAAGGAIAVDEGGLLVSDQNAFFFNISVDRGGAIAADGGAIQIQDSHFLANQGTRSGALDVRGAAVLQVLDSEFVINASPQLVVAPGVGTTLIARSGIRGLPVVDVGQAILLPPSEFAMLELLPGDGLVRIEDSRFLGAERYLDVFTPVDVRRSVFWGALDTGDTPSSIVVTGTLADFRRNIMGSGESGPVTFSGSVGTVANNLFVSADGGLFVESDGAGSLFGPVLNANGFTATVSDEVISGTPIYPSELNNPALRCFGLAQDHLCVAQTHGSLLDPANVPLYRFHPDLDPSLWDLHLRPIGGFTTCGAIGPLPPSIGPHADPHSDYSRDTDLDGWPDGWAQAVGVVGSSCADDPDGDHLNNFEELQMGSHPQIADTDGDGLDDRTEAEGSTDVLDADTDDDGLDDATELHTGTDPTNPDSDGDGIPDGEDPAPNDPRLP